MIREVLNREFVDQILLIVRQDLENAVKDEATPSAERRRDSPASSVTAEDYRKALEAAVAVEKEHNSPQPATDRRGDDPQPTEPYLERDPVISLLQTAIELYLEEKESERIQEEEETPDDRRGGKPQPVPVSNRSLKDSDLDRRERAPDRRLFDKFSITDPRWVSSLVAEGLRAFRGKHPFKSSPPKPLAISNTARVILLGDWGTGIRRALNVSARIREILAEGRRERREQHVIHLGDVYYSGWKTEYLKRFLGPKQWPVEAREAGDIGSWSLNGNHDMYSGGWAYFDTLLADPRFSRQQQSSYFVLQNDNWEILGLDTAWKDEDLQEPQADWVMSRVQASTRKLMLLSHHQVLSAYEKPCPKVLKKLNPVLATQHVRAWFWGHEHRCALYKAQTDLPFARCIGHGGVPVYMPRLEGSPTQNPAEYEFRGSFLTPEGPLKGIERWALFGFAVLDFDGSSIKVRYIDETGAVYRREQIA